MGTGIIHVYIGLKLIKLAYISNQTGEPFGGSVAGKKKDQKFDDYSVTHAKERGLLGEGVVSLMSNTNARGCTTSAEA